MARPEHHKHIAAAHNHFKEGCASGGSPKKWKHEEKADLKMAASGGATRNWIAGATKNKGALHRALGVPQGQKIPASKLAKAAHSKNPTMRKRAALAKTLAGFHK